MPGMYCRKCGTAAMAEDRFCPNCGASLDPGEARETGTRQARAASHPWRTFVPFIAAGMGVLVLILLLLLILLLNRQSQGASPLDIEWVGAATAYPTSAPYRTARPYPTATDYPTHIPYPTTGLLATFVTTPLPQGGYAPYTVQVPGVGIFSPNCSVDVENRNPDLDAFIVMTDVESGERVAEMYIRANDSYTQHNIGTGTYEFHIALGLDWDHPAGRFRYIASAFRFKEQTVFTTCQSWMSGGSWQYLDIILNASEGQGSETIAVPLEDFPFRTP